MLKDDNKDSEQPERPRANNDNNTDLLRADGDETLKCCRGTREGGRGRGDTERLDVGGCVR